MTTTQPRARARAALPRAFSLDQELIEALLELERSSELLPRPDRERVEKWAQRLASVPLPTVASKRNRNQYALLLVQQVKQCTAATKAGSNQLNWRPPFHRDPPAGLLPRLPPALSCLVESRRVRTAPWQRIFGSLASSAVLPAAEFDSCGSLEVDAEKTKHTDQTKRLPKRRVRFVGVEDKNQVAGAAGVHSDQPPPPVVAPAAVAAAPAADADGKRHSSVDERKQSQRKCTAGAIGEESPSPLDYDWRRERLVLLEEIDSLRLQLQSAQRVRRALELTLSAALSQLQDRQTVAKQHEERIEEYKDTLALHESVIRNLREQLGSCTRTSEQQFRLQNDVHEHEMQALSRHLQRKNRHCIRSPEAVEDFLAYVDRLQQEVQLLTST